MEMVLNCKFNDVPSGIANAAQPGKVKLEYGIELQMPLCRGV